MSIKEFVEVYNVGQKAIAWGTEEEWCSRYWGWWCRRQNFFLVIVSGGSPCFGVMIETGEKDVREKKYKFLFQTYDV